MKRNMSKIIFLVLTSVFFAVANVNAADLTVNGAVKTATLCDENGNNCTAVISLVPAGMIAPFYLASCPAGWVAADGQNGTPDLRGQFIRGLNDFGSVEGARNDGKEDPDGEARALGDYQGDAFQTHKHNWRMNKSSGAIHWLNESNYHPRQDQGGQAEGVPNYDVENTVMITEPSTGNHASETRPKNVALIFCMKQ